MFIGWLWKEYLSPYLTNFNKVFSPFSGEATTLNKDCIWWTRTLFRDPMSMGGGISKTLNGLVYLSGSKESGQCSTLEDYGTWLYKINISKELLWIVCYVDIAPQFNAHLTFGTNSFTYLYGSTAG